MISLTPEARRAAADALLAYVSRRWVVCDHAQILDPGGAVDAVVAALAEASAEDEQITDADISDVLDGDGALCPGCVRILVEQLRDERDRARTELDDLAAQNAKTEDNFRDFAEDALAVQRERDRLAEQVNRVRDYARGGCLGSKSTIYNRVGEDLLTIVGDGTEAGR